MTRSRPAPVPPPLARAAVPAFNRGKGVTMSFFDKVKASVGKDSAELEVDMQQRPS